MRTILSQIRQGMTVCDRRGAEIGTVDFVQMTDEDPSAPGAQTATVSPALRNEDGSLIGFIADAFRTDAVPDTVRDQLLRRGFIRVDADGLFAADRYVMPDQIDSVSGDRVMLVVDKDELIKER